MRMTLMAGILAAATLAAPLPALADRYDGYRGERQYQRTDNGIRYWQGEDGRYYCRKSNGTTGLLIGGVAGALIGRTIDTRGDRTPGTLLGAVGGALIGREIERSSARCR
jgi:outer membrane lipoprotein SlyB